MAITIKILGIVIIGIAFILMIRIGAMKRLLEYMLAEVRSFYVVGIIRLTVGAFLLLAASQSRIPLIILILGILFLVSGILVFLIGTEKSKAYVSWVLQKSPLVHRLMLLLPILLAALMIYSA